MRARRLATCAVAFAAFWIPASAQAQTVVDGKTAPVYSYGDAVRERVFICARMYA